MGGFFSTLFAKIVAALDWIGQLFVAVFTAGWDILRDVPAWIFEQMMTVAVTAMNGLSLTGITNNMSAYGSIPANVMLVLSAVGMGPAMALVGSALLIRFTLQLIPFVRLGS